MLQDVLTDLKADAETLPLDPSKEEWVGHKVCKKPTSVKKELVFVSLFCKSTDS